MVLKGEEERNRRDAVGVKTRPSQPLGTVTKGKRSNWGNNDTPLPHAQQSKDPFCG